MQKEFILDKGEAGWEVLEREIALDTDGARTEQPISAWRWKDCGHAEVPEGTARGSQTRMAFGTHISEAAFVLTATESRREGT